MESGMPPKLGEPKPPKEGNWFMRLPTWAKWTVGVVSAILLLAVGAVIGSGEEDTLKDDIATLEAELSEAGVERDAAEAKKDELESEQAEVLADAQAKADGIISEAEDKAGSVVGAAATAKQDLKAAEGKLDDVEGEIGGAEERVAKSKISDGVWKLDTDYVAGTYEAEGGPRCYWEKLSDPSGEFDSIITNENGESRQLLTIDSPYFSTNGCGTWTLVE